MHGDATRASRPRPPTVVHLRSEEIVASIDVVAAVAAARCEGRQFTALAAAGRVVALLFCVHRAVAAHAARHAPAARARARAAVGRDARGAVGEYGPRRRDRVGLGRVVASGCLPTLVKQQAVRPARRLGCHGARGLVEGHVGVPIA